MSARRMARLALLTAVALSLFVVESQLPDLFPIPGAKLGLANICLLYTSWAARGAHLAGQIAPRQLDR